MTALWLALNTDPGVESGKWMNSYTIRGITRTKDPSERSVCLEVELDDVK